MTHPRCRKQGAYTVELALVIPVLLAFIMGVLEAGNTIHHSVITAHATQEAVRQLAIGATLEGARTVLLDQMGDPCCSTVSIEAEYRRRQGSGLTDWAPLPEDESGNTAPIGSQIRVTVTRRHALLFGTLFSRLAGNTGQAGIDLVVSRTTHRE